MRKFLVAIASVSIVVTSAPAFALDSESQSNPGAERKKANQIICRRSSTIGSRVQKRKDCMSRAEWIRLENGTRDEMGRLISRATQDARGN